MSKQAFEDVISELLKTIKLCIKEKSYRTCLILIYSGIDTMGWLYLPKNKLDSDRESFTIWVRKFFLPNSGLMCNETDLYAARCGLVHSNTAEARLIREGEAKRICYAYGTKKVADLRKLLDSIGKYSDIPVKIEELFNAFQSSINCFKQHLLNHPEKAKVVYERADKLLVKFPSK